MSINESFRLQPVLNFKSSMVENLEMEFAHLKTAYQAELQSLSQLERASQRQTDILCEEQKQNSLNCQAIRLHQRYLGYLNENVVQQKMRVEEAGSRLELKREKLVEMMKDQKTLENLRQRHQTRVTRETNHREARVIDDMVTTRYAREGLSHV